MTPSLPLDRLSEGERDILIALSQGATVAQIARERHVTPHAVSARMHRAGRRLGIRPGTSTQIVAEAIRRRWIE